MTGHESGALMNGINVLIKEAQMSGEMAKWRAAENQSLQDLGSRCWSIAIWGTEREERWIPGAQETSLGRTGADRRSNERHFNVEEGGGKQCFFPSPPGS